jgi:hypothetical protein
LRPLLGTQRALSTRGARILRPPCEVQVAVDAALRDAATQPNVGAGLLRVERVESQEWLDTLPGCPKPCMHYVQVITPSYLVVIARESERLEYHTDARDRAVFCWKP